MARNKLLVVDDERGIRFNLQKYFSMQGYDVAQAESCEKALEVFEAEHPDLAIIDCYLPDGEGLELIQKFRALESGASVIVLTAHESIDLAVRAIKSGAEHFLVKPVDLSALLALIKKTLHAQRLQQKQTANDVRQARDVIDPFAGTSNVIRRFEDQAKRVAGSWAPVLICGETGAGKGVLARWLHSNSPRADEPFVDFNCAALNKDLLESELFGYRKGAYTGAVDDKPGLLEIANRGTIFLDEIGDMDMQVQPKLLKVLEEKRFRRVGGINDISIDIHLIAATHGDLKSLVQNSQFRSDLFFRISTVPLYVPPLRARSEDIPQLAANILSTLSKDIGCGAVTLSASAIQALQTYHWPGNIRELRNVIERALLLSGSKILGAEHLHFTFADVAPAADLQRTDLTLEEAEREYIDRVLRANGGRVENASQVLGLSRSALYQKIKKHDISIGRTEAAP